ncbi:hypothetical protein KKA69_05250 [Patescibacteria group bacterium]|nr:hypothetical protein [Patescibacteria group bacterium]
MKTHPFLKGLVFISEIHQEFKSMKRLGIKTLFYNPPPIAGFNYIRLILYIIFLSTFAYTGCGSGSSEIPSKVADANQSGGGNLSFEESFFGIYSAYNHDDYGFFKNITGMTSQEFYDWTNSHQEILKFHWTVPTVLAWQSVEPELGGNYDWNNKWDLDDKIKAIAKNGQVNIKMIVRALRDDSDWRELKDDFQRFIKDSVKRYDGDGILDAEGSPTIKYWSAFGEVRSDGGPFYLTVEDYIRYVTWMEEAVHSVDSTAKIVLAAFQTGDGTMSEDLKNIVDGLIAAQIHFDVVDYHNWGRVENWKMDTVAEIRSFLDERGLIETQIWSGENGTWVGNPTSQSIVQSEREQAIFLAKRFSYGPSVGLSQIMWNNLIDWYNFDGDPNSIYNSMGLIGDGALNDEDPDRINIPRIAYYTYAMLASVIDKPENRFVRQLTFTNEPDIYGFEYEELTTGRKKVVLWSESGSSTVTISVNSNLIQVTNLITDLGGNIREQYTLPAVAGSVIITVDEDPLIVVEK